MPNIAEQIAKSVGRLPDNAAREVLDFAHFLLLREETREDRDLILEAVCQQLGCLER